MMAHVEITFETTIVLGFDELWPDDDAPDPVTAEHVENLIKAHGGPSNVLSDWGLGPLSTHIRVL